MIDDAVTDLENAQRELGILHTSARNIPAKYGATREWIVGRIDAILKGIQQCG